MSDGKATAGVQDREVLLQSVRALSEVGIRRLDVVAADGGERQARDEREGERAGGVHRGSP